MTSPSDNLSPISPDKTPESVGKPILPGQAPEGFETYMQGSNNQPRTPPPQGPTPMEVTRGPSFSTAGLSSEGLLAQANTVQDTLGLVHKQLNDQNLKLKRSQTLLVKQKLGDANSYIRSAGAKIGADLPESKTPAGLSGIKRFIAMVNDGQNQIAQVQQQIADMTKAGKQIDPADMLTIQVKMGLAQQEIEYTSTLLGKVIQSITQLLNTQL